mmetsp:Transcript_16334/g.44341  ORF Transcript_16334/g.44341 Transcript_16334/m.44341 type:complete len:383 (-) Transcript_16334:334-1482(-)
MSKVIAQETSGDQPHACSASPKRSAFHHHLGFNFLIHGFSSRNTLFWTRRFRRHRVPDVLLHHGHQILEQLPLRACLRNVIVWKEPRLVLVYELLHVFHLFGILRPEDQRIETKDRSHQLLTITLYCEITLIDIDRDVVEILLFEGFRSAAITRTHVHILQSRTAHLGENLRATPTASAVCVKSARCLRVVVQSVRRANHEDVDLGNVHGQRRHGHSLHADVPLCDGEVVQPDIDVVFLELLHHGPDNALHGVQLHGIDCVGILETEPLVRKQDDPVSLLLELGNVFKGVQHHRHLSVPGILHTDHRRQGLKVLRSHDRHRGDQCHHISGGFPHLGEVFHHDVEAPSRVRTVGQAERQGKEKHRANEANKRDDEDYNTRLKR